MSSAAVVNLVEHGVSYPHTAARAEDQQMDAVGVWTDFIPTKSNGGTTAGRCVYLEH